MGFFDSHPYGGWGAAALMLAWHIIDKVMTRGEVLKTQARKRHLRQKWLDLMEWERRLINTENAVNDSKKPE